ncbi:unnamed protein product [Coregonus sp. 'balchen']|nr:unnamed protein product [Coregonus sp. 'balchen']
MLNFPSAVKECDFVDHSGASGDTEEINAEGNVEGLLADFKLNVGLKCSNEQESSFGRLKKEETREKPRAILGVLMERIMTSQPCPVTTKVRKRGNVEANVSTCVALREKASMKQSGSTQTDSDVSLVIPANTVVAYSLIELFVKCNGQFELCLFSNKGGFEKVRSNYEFEEDGIMDLVCDFDANSPLNLKKELEKLSSHFQLLSVLPAATRSSLLQLLKTTMEDGEAVSVLESVAILDLVDQCVGEDEIRSSLLTAIHLIVSAMDGMTDEGLSVLGSCCSPPVLQALQILVQHVAAGSGETLSLRDAGLAVLTEEEVFGRTESLFGHSKVTLKREEDTLRTEMKDQPGYLPLVMSITVKGLASLV